MNVANKTEAGFFTRLDAQLEQLIRGWNPYDPEKLKDRDLEPVKLQESHVRRVGARLVMIVMTGFLIWALTAPLDSGSVVPGVVTVAGYRKAVQHPNGGVVSRVLVSEGSEVVRGQVLVEINPLEADANASNLEQEYINLLVSESRAMAELMGGPIRWSPELSKLNPARVEEAKKLQSRLLATRRAQFGEQVRGLEAQIAGLSGAIDSHAVQLGTLSQELKSVERLAKDGFVPKSQVNSTLRDKVDQEAALQTARSEVGKTRAQIAEVRSQMLSEVAKELSELQKNRESIASKLQAARFSQSLSEIRAPVTGTVVNLRVFTEGGVISSGEVLMEVVPKQNTLIVEAKVPPSAIDTVRTGQEADIRFTSFNSVTTPVVSGRVKAVGVDKLKAKPGEELREGEDYYLAQIETTPEALKALGKNELQPGMPADVIIKRGERTFMSYLLKPLTDKFALAFKD